MALSFFLFINYFGCAGFSAEWTLFSGRNQDHLVLEAFIAEDVGLWSVGSVIVAYDGLSCSLTYEVFQDQGSNLCPLHWQVDS